MFRGNQHRTGVYQTECVPKGEFAWKHVVAGGVVTSPPVIADGTVFFGTNGSGDKKRRFLALDAVTGNKKWSLPIDNEVRLPAAVSEGFVCLPDGYIIRCVAADTGDERWRVPLSGLLESEISIHDGVVFAGEIGVAGSGHYYHAIDLRSGREVWKQEMEEPAVTAPAVDQGILYFVTNKTLTSPDRPNHVLTAMDSRTGEIRWRNCNIQGAVRGTPVLCEGTVVVPGGERIYFYEAQTGESLWQWDMGRDSVCGSVAVKEGVVHCGNWQGLLARRIEAGKTLWHFPVEDNSEDEEDGDEDSEKRYFTAVTAVSIAGETAFVGLADGRFYAADIHTGQKQWDFEMDELEEGDLKRNFKADRRGPAIDSGMVYFGVGNTLYALR